MLTISQEVGLGPGVLVPCLVDTSARLNAVMRLVRLVLSRAKEDDNPEVSVYFFT